MARAWFVGENPYLDEHPPVIAIRNGRIEDALHAVQSFLDDTA